MFTIIICVLAGLALLALAILLVFGYTEEHRSYPLAEDQIHFTEWSDHPGLTPRRARDSSDLADTGNRLLGTSTVPSAATPDTNRS